jgi:hypothetical protein
MPPFSIFHSLLSHFLGFRYLPFDLHVDGIRSRLTIPDTVVWQLTPMKNPVTGEDEYATRDCQLNVENYTFVRK